MNATSIYTYTVIFIHQCVDPYSWSLTSLDNPLQNCQEATTGSSLYFTTSYMQLWSWIECKTYEALVTGSDAVPTTWTFQQGQFSTIVTALNHLLCLFIRIFLWPLIFKTIHLPFWLVCKNFAYSHFVTTHLLYVWF